MHRILLLIVCLLPAGGALLSQTAPAGQVVASPQPLSSQEIDAFMARLQQEFAQKANLITDYYVKSQQAFYNNNHQLALQHINNAIDLIESADLHAFKGAILFGMGNRALARAQFEKALGLDDKVPIPKVTGLSEWLTEQRLTQ